MKNINWIVSYPKSGNTMVRLFLCAYLFTEKGIINDLKISKAIKKFNSGDVYNHYKKFDLNYYNTNPYEISKHFIPVQKNLFNKFKENIFFFKTHNAFSNQNMKNFTDENITRSAIYIIRDPRSVLLSKIHHFNFNSQKESLKFMINDSRFSLGSKNSGSFPEIISSWANHYRSWYNFISSKKIGLIVKYEDLIKNSEDEFRKILNYLAVINNFSFNEKKFQNSLSSIDFNNLKKLETSRGFDERTGKNENFFRKGIIDEWKTTLNSEILDIIQNRFNSEMKELNYI